jgi:hypothetical protein
MKQEKIVLHIIARMNVGGTARYIKTLSRELPKFSYRAVLAIGNVQGQEIEDWEKNPSNFGLKVIHRASKNSEVG